MFITSVILRFFNVSPDTFISTLTLSYAFLIFVLVATTYYLLKFRIVNNQSLTLIKGSFKSVRNNIVFILVTIMLYQIAVIGWQGIFLTWDGSGSAIDTSPFNEYFQPISLVHFLVIVPLGEEILFRGILLHRSSIKWGNSVAVFLTSSLFALLHGDNFLPIFFSSLIIVCIYIKFGSFLYVIIHHLINNAISILVIYVQHKTGSLFNIETASIYTFCIMLLVPLVLAIIYLNKNKREFSKVLPLLK